MRMGSKMTHSMRGVLPTRYALIATIRNRFADETGCMCSPPIAL
jgi:hypothetical protein